MATTSYGTPYVVSADLVSGYPGTSLSLADRVDDISFKGNGINNQTGTTYTLDILDAGKTVTLSNGSAVTVTIPTNTAEAIEIGSIIRFNNKGAGLVTIQPDGGVTLNGGNISLVQNAAAQIVKLDTNTWGAIESLATPPGLLLVSPSSIANSGGSASASGGAVTFSGVSSVSLNGVFTSTYDAYRIILSQGAADSATTRNISLRLRVGGTDNSAAASYNANQLFQYGASTTGGSGNNGTALLCGAFSGVDKNMFIALDVSDPAQAWRTLFTGSAWRYQNDVAAWVHSSFGGSHTVDTAYDGFTLFPGSGTFSGLLRVYGYKK